MKLRLEEGRRRRSSISIEVIRGGSGGWAEWFTNSFSERNVTERTKCPGREISSSRISSRKDISKSRRHTTLLLECKQKLRKQLKAQTDSLAWPVKAVALGTSPLSASSRVLALQYCCCLAFGWGRCCQNFPWAGGRLGRWEDGPQARPSRKLATLIRPPNRCLRVQNKITGRAGHGSWAPFTCAKYPPHFTLTTTPRRGALLTSLQRGQNKLGQVKFHARDPRWVRAEFWLKSRPAWHPDPRSFHYTVLGLCQCGACERPKIFFPWRFLSQSYKGSNLYKNQSLPELLPSLRILWLKGRKAL